MLIAAIPWEAIGAIAAVLALGGTIWQIRSARARSRISVMAYLDETWHMKVVVTNEKGNNPITITSVAPTVSGKVVDTKPKGAPRDIDSGKTETWSFDVVAPAGAEPRKSDVKVRVDSGRRHWIKKAEYGAVLET
jgi:hypothetical protein